NGVINFPDVIEFPVSYNLPAKVVLQADVVPNVSSATYVFAISSYGMSGSARVDYYPTSLTLSGKDSEVKVIGTSTTNPTVTVLSPNGGENLQIGTYKTIKWMDTNDISTHEIHMIGLNPTTGVRNSNYTIANTQGASYSWLVGEAWGGNLVDGNYIAQICQSSTSNCDESNNYFTIS